MGWWPKYRVRGVSAAAAASDALIRNTSFSSLWGAQVLSQVAQHLLNFALIIRVFELAQHTRLANISVALLILSFGVPSIFFAAAAGVYVDRWNRKWVLVVANFMRALLVLGYLLFEQNLAMVLILSFLIATATQFFAPAEAASIPALVSEKHLLRANSLFIFTMYASFIVGYSASAPVIALLGSDGPYYLTALMFAGAGLLTLALPSLKAASRKVVRLGGIVRTTVQEVNQNWRIIRSNRNLSFPIAQLTITQATVGVMLALAPALSLAVLHTPIQNASHVLVIPAGIGMVVGVLMLGRLAVGHTKVRLITVCLIVAAGMLVLLGLTGQLHRPVRGQELASLNQIGWVVALIVLLLGVMNAIVSSAAQTLLQEHTTDETRGKVFGALNMMVNIAAVVPIFFAGILADFTSPTKVVFVLGMGLFMYAIGQWYYLHVRHKLP